MKNKIISGLVVAFFVSAVFIGCKKDETVAGKGEIKGYSTYNSKTIKPATFYVKFGVTTSPGADVSKYDKNNLSDSDGKFDFKTLGPGDYFIYAVATDNGVNLSGGVHVVLAQDELKDNVVIVLNP